MIAEFFQRLPSSSSSGSLAPRPAAAAFSRIARLGVIGIGLRVRVRRFLPFRLDGTISIGSLPACRSPTSSNAIWPDRAPVAA